MGGEFRFASMPRLGLWLSPGASSGRILSRRYGIFGAEARDEQRARGRLCLPRSSCVGCAQSRLASRRRRLAWYSGGRYRVFISMSSRASFGYRARGLLQGKSNCQAIYAYPANFARATKNGHAEHTRRPKNAAAVEDATLLIPAPNLGATSHVATPIIRIARS